MNSITIVVFSLCVAACFAATPAKSSGSYTTKYDSINLDEILNNPKLVKNYVNCLSTGTNCTPQGKELRGKCIASNCITTQHHSQKFSKTKYSSNHLEYILILENFRELNFVG